MQPPENASEIAEKVRTGEYFRTARGMYDVAVHDLMAERYFYILITCLSLIIFIIVQVAMNGLYPLNTPVPFIYSTNDIVEDMPHMESLLASKGETPSDALLRFFVRNYVTMREEYDIALVDRDSGGVQSQSSEAVLKEYEQAIDPRNPASPLSLYQRHSKRRIAILSTRRSEGGMEVVFDAVVDGPEGIKKSNWRANIAFNYSGIALDEKTQKPGPVQFLVTQYHSTRL